MVDRERKFRVNHPQLSVIIPVYNAGAYIKETMRSLTGQTFSDFEVICVEDRSKDDSLSILRELARQDDRIRIIALDKNVGAGEARNVGLGHARGTYITFLDADDTIESDLYERAMALTEGGSVDQVVWGAVEEHYDAGGRHIRSVSLVPAAQDCQTYREIGQAALRLEEQTLFGYLWNSLYKGQIIRDHAIKLGNMVFYEDYFFNLEVIRHTRRLRVLDYGGYHYFKRVNASVTHRFSEDYFALSYSRVDSFYRFCLERELLTREARRILGIKLLRYTLSALARNHHPLSRMTDRERKRWLQEILQKPLYGELLGSEVSLGPVWGTLRRMVLEKNRHLLLLTGKLCYILRR